MRLIDIALAPIFIILIYVYVRDKYEKEPVSLLLAGVFFGALIAVPVIIIEEILSKFTPHSSFFTEALYTSFIIAATTEELFKFMTLKFLVWKNKNFNEKFDGIVYAVFISLGFAGIENVMYVFNGFMGGLNTAILRGFFAVPAHGLFGVAMGYYFAMSKFEAHNKKNHLLKAFFVPWLLHGVYDFILMYENPYIFILFIPFVLYLWVSGFRKMKKHVESSPFKPVE